MADEIYIAKESTLQEVKTNTTNIESKIDNVQTTVNNVQSSVNEIAQKPSDSVGGIKDIYNCEYRPVFAFDLLQDSGKAIALKINEGGTEVEAYAYTRCCFDEVNGILYFVCKPTSSHTYYDTIVAYDINTKTRIKQLYVSTKTFSNLTFINNMLYAFELVNKSIISINADPNNSSTFLTIKSEKVFTVTNTTNAKIIDSKAMGIAVVDFLSVTFFNPNDLSIISTTSIPSNIVGSFAVYDAVYGDVEIDGVTHTYLYAITSSNYICRFDFDANDWTCSLVDTGFGNPYNYTDLVLFNNMLFFCSIYYLKAVDAITLQFIKKVSISLHTTNNDVGNHNYIVYNGVLIIPAQVSTSFDICAFNITENSPDLLKFLWYGKTTLPILSSQFFSYNERFVICNLTEEDVLFYKYNFSINHYEPYLRG